MSMSTFKKILVAAYCYDIVSARVVRLFFKYIKSLKSA